MNNFEFLKNNLISFIQGLTPEQYFTFVYCHGLNNGNVDCMMKCSTCTAVYGTCDNAADVFECLDRFIKYCDGSKLEYVSDQELNN